MARPSVYKPDCITLVLNSRERKYRLFAGEQEIFHLESMSITINNGEMEINYILDDENGVESKEEEIHMSKVI